MEQWLLAGVILRRWKWAVRKIVKWVLMGVCLAFVVWLIAVETGHGPAIEYLIGRIFEFSEVLWNSGKNH